MLDWRTPRKSSVKDLLKLNVEIARQYKLSNKRFPVIKSKNHDEIVMRVFNWVCNNYDYKRDIDKFGVQEKWEEFDEAFDSQYLDCEDMSMVMFAVCRAYDISPIQIRLVAGEVTTQNGLSGHCWVEYMPDSRYDYKNDKGIWVIFDPAYDPNNKLKVKDRLNALDDTRYVRRWFEVTDLDFA